MIRAKSGKKGFLKSKVNVHRSQGLRLFTNMNVVTMDPNACRLLPKRMTMKRNVYQSLGRLMYQTPAHGHEGYEKHAWPSEAGPTGLFPLRKSPLFFGITLRPRWVGAARAPSAEGPE